MEVSPLVECHASTSHEPSTTPCHLPNQPLDSFPSVSRPSSPGGDVEMFPAEEISPNDHAMDDSPPTVSATGHDTSLQDALLDLDLDGCSTHSDGLTEGEEDESGVVEEIVVEESSDADETATFLRRFNILVDPYHSDQGPMLHWPYVPYLSHVLGGILNQSSRFLFYLKALEK
ncbi:hypothetical protein E1B28_012953 [Marasmius oreades]|uniref:Uncharacterized protein n=1 Tax=Marasmius oreades TaxID=181124 RepID=A0A9P7RSL8_9AGAR|nr:uncharacterized protein E1B28_012953 [Marasmius oreades]KAG7089004.1 hypothetical protein E1B28_012953 [Marasmius oreades]